MSQDVRKSSSSNHSDLADRSERQAYSRSSRHVQQHPQQHQSHSRFRHEARRWHEPPPSRGHQQRARRDNHPADGKPYAHAQRAADAQPPPFADEQPLQPDEHSVCELMQLGFSDVDVRNALLITQNDANAAAGWLLAQQQERFEPAKPRAPRVPISAASTALKFKIGTSVSVDLPAPGAVRPEDPMQAKQSWLQLQAEQQARAKPTPAAVAAPVSAVISAAAPIPAGFLPVAQRLQQQDASVQLAATERTKAYLQQQPLVRAASDPFEPAGTPSVLASTPASRRADLELFQRSKRELFAHLFEADQPEPAPASSWLRMVAANPARALEVVQKSGMRGEEDSVYNEAALAAVDAHGWNAVHLCCHHGHARLLEALLSLHRTTASQPAATLDASPLACSDSASESDSAESSGSEAHSSDDAASSPSASHRPQQPQQRHGRLLFDPQLLTAQRSSAVHLCCRSRSHACLELLLSRNVLLDVKDARGHRALHVSSALGDTQAVEMLLQSRSHRSPPPPSVRSKAGQTALHLAAMFGHLSAVTLLHRCDRTLVHCKDKKHQLALHVALGFDDVVSFLLRQDVSHHAAGGDREESTHGVGSGGVPASSGSNTPMVNAVTTQHQCALSLSLALPPSIAERTMRLLLSMDASLDPLALNRSGSQGLLHSEVLGAFDHAKVVNLRLRSRHTLLRKRAAVMQGSHRTRMLITPLHDAALLGLDWAVALLLQHGAPIDAPSHPHRSTPLHYACRGGHAEMVALLLRQGADRSRLNALGGSSLMFAARGGHARVVEPLLTSSATASSASIEWMKAHVDPRGETALSLALAADHSEVVRVLVHADAALVNTRVMEAVQARIDSSTRALGLSSVRRSLASLLCAAEDDGTQTPFADVLLHGADGAALPCHAFILCARSDVLRGLIEQQERQEQLFVDGCHRSARMLHISLSHVPRSLLHTVLFFLYRGCIPRQLSASTLVQLILLSNELLLPRLFSLCVQVASSMGYLSAEAQSRLQLAGGSLPMLSTLAQMQELLAPHVQEQILALAMQQAADTARAASNVAEVAPSVAVSSSQSNPAVDSSVPLDDAGIDDPAAAIDVAVNDDELLSAALWPPDASPSPLSSPALNDVREEEYIAEPCRALDQDLFEHGALRPDVLLVTVGEASGSVEDEKASCANSSGALSLEEDDDDASQGVKGLPVHRCMLATCSLLLSRLCDEASSRQSPLLRVPVPLSATDLSSLLDVIYAPSQLPRTASALQPRSFLALLAVTARFLDPASEAASLFTQQTLALLLDGGDAGDVSHELLSGVLAPVTAAPMVYDKASALFALLRGVVALAAEFGAEGVRCFDAIFFRLVKTVLVRWHELCVPPATYGVGLALREHLALTHPEGASTVAPCEPHVCLMLQVLDWSQLRARIHSPVDEREPSLVCPCLQRKQ